MDLACGWVHKLAKKNETNIFPVRTAQASSITSIYRSVSIKILDCASQNTNMFTILNKNMVFTCCSLSCSSGACPSYTRKQPATQSTPKRPKRTSGNIFSGGPCGCSLPGGSCTTWRRSRRSSRKDSPSAWRTFMGTALERAFWGRWVQLSLSKTSTSVITNVRTPMRTPHQLHGRIINTLGVW